LIVREQRLVERERERERERDPSDGHRRLVPAFAAEEKRRITIAIRTAD